MCNPPFEATVRPRRFTATLPDTTPRHWCDENPVVTHLLNCYTLLIPGNEGYYIRTLRRVLPQLPESMRGLVTRFCLQEGQHGSGHLRHQTLLENQGYRIRGFQRRTDAFLYKFVERLTPFKVRLAIVACVEHLNAYLGHEFLSQRILEDADPALRALFEWHFAEEIEHKHVAYDVLQATAPSYPLRVTGALLAMPLFYLLVTTGMLNLLRQDKLLGQRRTWRLFREHLFSGHHMARRSLGHLRDYLRPGFHPWQLRDYELAQAVLTRYGSEQAALLEPFERPGSDSIS
jgi:predicted metal-dependent hydrolase